MSHGIGIELLTYHSNIKGLGERQFAFLSKELTVWKTKDGKKEMPESGYLTIDEFMKCTILAIIKYNNMIQKGLYIDNDMLADNVPPIPINLWNWGIVTRSGLF